MPRLLSLSKKKHSTPFSICNYMVTYIVIFRIFVTIKLHDMAILEKLVGEIMNELGEHLKQLRKNQKYSQLELANQIGVSRRLIGEIESGKGTSLLVFIKLLKVFNKTEKLLEILESTTISPKDLFTKSIK